MIRTQVYVAVADIRQRGRLGGISESPTRVAKLIHNERAGIERGTERGSDSQVVFR